MKKLLISLCLMVCAGCAGLHPETDVAGIDERMRTWKEQREEHVVMQRYDYSCGAAALATLIKYYFGDDLDEQAILDDILDQLDRDSVDVRKKEGLSMLDLKHAAERQGYVAAGIKLDFVGLARLPGPVLLYLDTQDGRHFAVYRGVMEDRVYLADPSRGNVRMPLYTFLEEWPGYTLVLGKDGFGLPEAHDLAVGRDETMVCTEQIVARRAMQ